MLCGVPFTKFSNFLMFDGWEFCHLEADVGFFFQSLQCNSVRGSGGPLQDNGALFEFGRDLLLSTSKIVALRLER